LKTKKLIIALILFITIISISTVSKAMSHYQTVGTTTGLVTASALNVRQGPGTNYKAVTMIYKNEYIRVFAKIGDWYVIQTNGDYIGMVSSKYVKLIYPKSNNSNNQNTNNTTNNTTTNNGSSLTADEKEVFDLINAKRTAARLSALKVDAELQNVARAKAEDMVKNNYFSHTSPTYGSPFDMMKSFGVSYKTAGENIAGNSSNTGAVNAWMNSEGHKANILNSSFNYTGVAVVKSSKYGKIFVQMFIGK
jgi:uncharacterized YkwD family protein